MILNVDNKNIIDDNAQDNIDELIFGEWVNNEINKKGLSIGYLVEKTGIIYTGIWNIIKGNTVSPRPETRKKNCRCPKRDSTRRY